MQFPSASLSLPSSVESHPIARSRWRSRIALVFIGTLALVSSAILHLGTAPGRSAARDAMVAVINGRIRGRATIDVVRRLDFDGVTLEGFEVIAPSGTVVIHVARLEAEFGFLELARSGHFLLAPCTLDGGTMRLTRGPRDQIELIYALEVPEERLMLVLDAHDIRMRNVTVLFDLPGAPAVQMAEVSGLIDMSLGHTFTARFDGVRGYVNIPVLHVGFEQLSGRLRGDAREPLRVVMVLELEIARPLLHIHYLAPRVVGSEGAAGLGIDLRQTRATTPR